jgi:DNA-binding beta-propeller fold protein YncE
MWFRNMHLLVALILPLAMIAWGASTGVGGGPSIASDVPHRSPVDLVLTPDGRFLLTANQGSATVSLVRIDNGKIVAEVACGSRPSAIVITPDARRVLVTGASSGTLELFDLAGETLTPAGRIQLGFSPHGIAVSPDGKVAYVALTTAHMIAAVDLARLEVLRRIPCGRWPRYVALSPDGRRLAVGANADGGVAVIDTGLCEQAYLEDFNGLNLGHMQVSKDGKYVYFPWIVYRHNPITANNIRQGWVLASRIARVKLDGPARREAIALDPQGKAVSDPFGLALSPDERWLAASASGTQELLVFKLSGLPFQDYGGPGDHINAELLQDSSRFFRISLGGRPMAVRFDADGARIYVANYLLDAVQVINQADRRVEQTFHLGGPKEPSLARKGEAIFFDGRRSLDQWYSCHSCHYEGHTNAVAMDTRNDGRNGNFKTVLSLRNVADTGPWTWHGWQKDIKAAMSKSLADTMLGPEVTDDDVTALIAYLSTLRPPPNSYRNPDGSLPEAATRGEKLFQSERAGCARCHPPPYYTDGKVHDVGLGASNDVFKGFNPPSLLGAYDRVLYLHDGRARSLQEVLRGPHSPSHVTGQDDFTDTELQDLLEYLRCL